MDGRSERLTWNGVRYLLRHERTGEVLVIDRDAPNPLRWWGFVECDQEQSADGWELVASARTKGELLGLMGIGQAASLCGCAGAPS